MQTFLPYPDFRRSAQVLDDKRLGKQRVEANHILKIITNRTNKKGWRNHPAVLMWRGYEEALKLYLNACIEEWERRGFKNRIARQPVNEKRLKMPWWLGREEFHTAHRANLLRKDQAYYQSYNWSEDPSISYWWPPHHQPDDKTGPDR